MPSAADAGVHAESAECGQRTAVWREAHEACRSDRCGALPGPRCAMRGWARPAARHAARHDGRVGPQESLLVRVARRWAAHVARCLMCVIRVPWRMRTSPIGIGVRSGASRGSFGASTERTTLRVSWRSSRCATRPHGRPCRQRALLSLPHAKGVVTVADLIPNDGLLAIC